MAISTKEYFEGILKTAGVTETKRQALLAQFEDEEVAKALANEVIAPKLRQEDYSRNMDALRVKEQQAVDYYAKLAKWEADFKAQQDAAQHSNGNGDRDVIQPVQGDFISKKDYEAELAKRDANYISLLKTGMKLTSQHMSEFKEALDVDGLEKIAIDKNVSLQQAYDDMVRDRRAAAQKALTDAEKEKYAEEKVRDFASKHKFQVDTAPREHHVMFNRAEKTQAVDDYVPNSQQLSQQATRNLRAGFAEEWNKAGSGTSGT
jgi:hypothetical protein